jgi:hypothetical protein
MLTSSGLRGLLLVDCHLDLGPGKLLLEGLLGLSSACSDSSSEHQDQDLTKAHRVSLGKR